MRPDYARVRSQRERKNASRGRMVLPEKLARTEKMCAPKEWAGGAVKELYAGVEALFGAHYMLAITSYTHTHCADTQRIQTKHRTGHKRGIQTPQT